MKNENGFPGLLERFFTQRLIAQRRVSSHTIASYRDTFRLLLQFVEKRLHKPPSRLALTDLDPALIGAFLDELEKDRGNGARSRNLRLTAIRSFYRYAAYEEPTQSGLIQRILAMPAKRYEKKLIGFLTRPEIEAVLAAPDLRTWAGRRDHAFLLVAVQTGDEDVGPAVVIVVADGNAHVVTGAGQSGFFGDVGKRQIAVVVKEAVAELRAVLGEPGHGAAVDEVDVEQAVAIVIEQGHAGDHAFGLLLGRAGAVESDEVHAGALRDLLKRDGTDYRGGGESGESERWQGKEKDTAQHQLFRVTCEKRRRREMAAGAGNIERAS